MLTTEQIKQTVSEYFKDKPVKKVYLFGSYARGEANEESDVDLLVDLESSKKVGFAFYGWFEELEQILKKRTDVIANSEKPELTSNWRFVKRINQDKVLLYERA